MTAASLIELGKQLREASVQLCFVGPFTAGIIQHFGAALRAYLKREQSNESDITSVFSVYIEMAQNIQRYTTRHQDALVAAGVGASDGIIVIGRHAGRTRLVSGNWVLAPSLAPLIERVRALASLDEGALKARYKQQMRAPVPEGADETAGLGLITIARYSTTPLECDAVDHHDGLAFFSLSAEV